jgi:hypothetical protein
VLVRLNCRSGFNVVGLECVIITERAHGPWPFGLCLEMLCLLIDDNNSVGV